MERELENRNQIWRYYSEFSRERQRNGENKTIKRYISQSEMVQHASNSNFRDKRGNGGKTMHNELMGEDVLELVKAWIVQFSNHRILQAG